MGVELGKCDVKYKAAVVGVEEEERLFVACHDMHRVYFHLSAW
jgi:hypothetical protein